MPFSNMGFQPPLTEKDLAIGRARMKACRRFISKYKFLLIIGGLLWFIL